MTLLQPKVKEISGDHIVKHSDKARIEAFLRRTGRRLPHRSPLWAVIAAMLLYAGCATVPKEVLDSDPALRLEQAPQVYVQLSGNAVRDTLLTMSQAELDALVNNFSKSTKSSDASGQGPQKSAKDPAMDASMLKSLLAKTKTVGAGLSGIGTEKPSGEAVLIGDFPLFSVKFALATSGEWQKNDEGYQSKRYPLYVRSPEPGILHISSFQPLSSGPGTSIKAVPDRFATLSRSDIFMSTDSPATLLGGRVPGEASAFPIAAILMTGKRVFGAEDAGAGGHDDMGKASGLAPDPSYSLDFYILMKDETTARAFKPVVRFFWTASAEKLFGGAIDVSSAPLTLEKDMYVVRNVETKASVLRKMLFASLSAK